jgi:PAS domain S-box-containing protein
MDVRACEDVEALCRGLDEGVAVVLLTAESLNPSVVGRIAGFVNRQPAWSDLPFLILGDVPALPEERPPMLRVDLLGNALVLPATIAPAALVSAVNFARRARRWQYSARDVLADRERTEEALGNSEARLRAVQELSLDAFSFLTAVRDTEGKIVDFRWDYVNPAAARLLFRTPEELIGRRMLSILPPGSHADEILRRCMEVIETGVSHEIEVQYAADDGGTGWFRNAAVRVGEGVAVYFSDITERKRAEESLRTLNETLEQRVAERTAVAEQRAETIRALARKLTEAEQRERRRLARVLHDHLQQILVAARLKTSLLRRRVDTESSRPSFDQIESLIGQAIEAARSLTVELCPPILYESGLARGLGWLANEMHENYGLSVRIDAEPDSEPEAEELRILLFESIRELLFNIVKHAQVSEAEVALCGAGPDEVRIEVADRGVGFQPASGVGSGSGLSSVNERLQWMRGRMEVQSSPGAGTRITILTPRRLPPACPVPNDLLRGSKAEEPDFH